MEHLELMEPTVSPWCLVAGYLGEHRVDVTIQQKETIDYMANENTALKQHEAPYLRISIGDNDFTTVSPALEKALGEMFYLNDFPGSEGLVKLREPIVALWVGAVMMDEAMKWDDDSRNNDYGKLREYMLERLKLEIVKFEDIPDWDNYESIYVPLYGDGTVESFVR